MEKPPATAAADNLQDSRLATLMLETAAADQAAMSRLYDATSPEIFAMVSAVFASPEKADQVLLDVYTDVWRHAPSFMPGSQPVRVWLRSLASLRTLESLHPVQEPQRNAPPEYVKDLLMARIEREPRSVSVHSRSGSQSEAGPGQAATASVAAPDAFRRFGPWVIAAVAVIAALVFLYRWRALEQGRVEQAEELAVVRAETEQVRGRLAGETARSADLQKIDNILASAGSRVIGLDGMPAGQTSPVAILWDLRSGEWLVTGYLQTPPAGKVYRLSMIVLGERRSVATLPTDSAGRTFALLRAPAAVPRPATLQITLEPVVGYQEGSAQVRAVGRIM